MNNTQKYIYELEIKNKELEERIISFQKEQSASIQLFREKEREIDNLTNSLNTLTKKNEKKDLKIKEIISKSQEQVWQLRETRQKIKSLEAELKKLKDQQELGEDFGLRVGVEGGGCSGMSYVLGFDQKKEATTPIAILNSTLDKTPVRTVNIMGENVDENYTGLIFIYYSDGTVLKKIR